MLYDHEEAQSSVNEILFDSLSAKRVNPNALKKNSALVPKAQQTQPAEPEDSTNKTQELLTDDDGDDDSIASQNATAIINKKLGWTVDKHISKSPMLKAMATVKISDADSSIYRDLLLLKRSTLQNYNVSYKDAKQEYSGFYKETLPIYLASISGGINKTFTALRAVCANAVNSSTPLTVEDIEETLNASIGAFDNNFADEKIMEDLLTGFCENMGSGNNHVIKYDPATKSWVVEFCGLPPRNSTESSTMSLQHNFQDENGSVIEVRTTEAKRLTNLSTFSINSSGKSIDLQSIPKGHPSIPLVTACQSTALTLLCRLFGQGFVTSGTPDLVKIQVKAHKRISKNFPLEYDFISMLNKQYIKVTGSDGKNKAISLGQLISPVKFNIPAPKSGSFNLSDYVNVMVYREPDPTIAQFYVNKLNTLMSDPEAIKTPGMITETLKQSIKNDKYLQTAALLLQPVVSVSFSIRIPNDIAAFISQSPTVSMFDLNAWISTWIKSAIKKKDTLEAERIPLFVFPLTKAKELKDLRAKHGFYHEEGKNNEDGIFVNEEGRLNYCPKESEETGADTNSVVFTKYADAYLNHLFSLGCPFTGAGLDSSNSRTMGYMDYNNTLILPDNDPNSTSTIDIVSTLEKKRGFGNILTHMKGALLTSSWNTNVICKASSWEESGFVDFTSLHLSSPPNVIDIADYLGFPFGKYKTVDEHGNEIELDNRKDASMSYSLLFPKSTVSESPTAQGTSTNFKSDTSLSNIAKTSPFQEFLNAYCYFVMTGQLKPFKELVEITKKMSKPWNTLSAFSEKDTPQDWLTRKTQNLYYAHLDNNFKVKANDRADKVYVTQQALFDLLDLAAKEAIGTDNHAILNNMAKIGLDISEYRINKGAPLSDYKKLFKFFGGAVILTAINQFLALDKKLVFSLNKDEYKLLTEYRKQVKEQSNGIGVETIYRPTFDTLSKTIYPFCVMMAQYVYNSDAIFAEATIEVDAARSQSDITEDDVTIPNVNEKGFSLMPHQFRAISRLHNKPARAILDISAGGGKTATYISEIGWMAEEIRTINAKNAKDNSAPQLKFKPLVVCPDNLIKSVCNEATAFLGKTWNVVPISSTVFNRSGTDGAWGQDKLGKLLDDPSNPPPPNTIYVTGYDFIKTNRFNMSVGTRVTPVYGAIEFLKKLGFNYLVFDESHFLKNDESGRHLTSKLLSSGSNVEYVRLATGTLIPNTAADILGQSSIFGANIFKTEKEFKSQFYKTVKGKPTDVMRDDAVDRIMGILSGFTSLITARRRDWAHLYPELLTSLSITPLADVDTVLGGLHKDLYEAILGRATENFRYALGLAPKPSGETAGSDDDPTDQTFGIKDSGDELLGISAEILKYWLQRLEQAIVDPFNDKTLFAAPEDGGLFQTEEDLNFSKQKEIEVTTTYIKNSRGKADDKKNRLANEMVRIDSKYETLLKISQAIKNIKDNRDDISLSTNNYFSPKIHKCIELVTEHLKKPNPWKARTTYKIYDRVMYNDTVYIAKRIYADGETIASKFVSSTTPDKDSKRWYKELAPGRIIFVCSYTRTAEILENALHKLMDSALLNPNQVRKYIHSGDEVEQALADFSNPTSNVLVLIANEKKIQVGHNLQIATRIIRVETPWTPGEVDQTASRIFRPDKKSKEPRPCINIDWLITTPSLEIPKMMRLIAKSVETNKLSEHRNPNFAGLRNFSLAPIKMTVENFCTMDAYNADSATEYFDAYNQLLAMQQIDIDTARKATSEAKEHDIKQIPAPTVFKAMPFKPMVTDQNMKDIHDLGLTKLSEYLILNKAELNKLRGNKNALNGKFVLTQYGSGKITGIDVNTYKEGNKLVIDPSRPVKKVEVKLLNCFKYLNSQIAKLNAHSVFIVGNVREATRLGLAADIKPVGTSRGKLAVNDDAQKAERDALVSSFENAILNGNTKIATTAVNTAVVRNNPVTHSDITVSISELPPEEDNDDSIDDITESTEESNIIDIFPIVINNKFALVDYHGEHGGLLTATTKMFKPFGGFIAADVTRSLDFYGAFEYIKFRIAEFNKTSSITKIKLAEESEAEFVAIYKVLRINAKELGSNVHLPIIKTGSFNTTFQKVYDGHIPDNDIYVFYMFTCDIGSDNSLNYRLKLCVDAKSRNTLKGLLRVPLGNPLTYQFKHGDKTYSSRFMFDTEPEKAMLVMSDTRLPVSEHKAASLYASKIVERLAAHFAGKVEVNAFAFDVLFEAYSEHLVPA